MYASMPSRLHSSDCESCLCPRLSYVSYAVIRNRTRARHITCARSTCDQRSPLRCSLRNGHLVPNGGSIIRARERRGVRLSGVRTVHTGPLAKSPILQRTLTLFPLALGTFRRIFFNLTRPAPHLKSIKPKAKRLCLPLLCRDARARGSSSFIKSRPPATYIIEHIKDSG